MGKGSDRTYRSLRGLKKTASTSRVLNSGRPVGTRNAGNPEHEKQRRSSPPSSLNGAVIVRHRLRDQEREAFDRIRYTATKLIIPFERSDLGLGGRSLFVSERGWLDTFEELRGEAPDFWRDVGMLEAIDELPSLDPFLLREHYEATRLRHQPEPLRDLRARPGQDAALRRRRDRQADRAGLPRHRRARRGTSAAWSKPCCRPAPTTGWSRCG